MYCQYRLLFIILSFSIVLGCEPANTPSSFLGDDNFSQQNYEITETLPRFIYNLGAGDKIRIIVFGEEELSGEFEVSNNGSISLPYIREVKAEGVDIKTLEYMIEKRYKQEAILKNPKVSIEVLEYRPFYIHGEVTKAGEFPYKAGMDIRNAVALAEGYTYRADVDIAYIRREGSSSVYKIDLTKGKVVPIYPGDNIQIPERFF